MFKNIFILSSALLVVQCASLGGTFEKEKVLKVKSVAIVGFTYDAPLETAKHLGSMLMGNEKSSGPDLMQNTKNEFAQKETETTRKVFDAISTSLKKNGWSVRSASDTQSSAPVKEFYNKSIKVGFHPLAKGNGRYEKEGLPQYAHVSSLIDKKEFQKFAKALNVDAIVAVSVQSEATQSIPFVTKINHRADIMLRVFDPTSDQLIMLFNSSGKEVGGHTKTKMGKDFEADIEAGALASVEQFAIDLREKLKN
jgi:hypothetical protein